MLSAYPCGDRQGHSATCRPLSLPAKRDGVATDSDTTLRGCRHVASRDAPQFGEADNGDTGIPYQRGSFPRWAAWGGAEPRFITLAHKNGTRSLRYAQKSRLTANCLVRGVGELRCERGAGS